MDSTRKLTGVVSIRDILIANDESLISEIMTENVVTVLTSTPDHEVSALFKKYDIHSLPVVDDENRMVGIITVDDILDVIEDTATEDFEKNGRNEAKRRKLHENWNYQTHKTQNYLVDIAYDFGNFYGVDFNQF